MSAAPPRVGIQPGEGVVARVGDAVIVTEADALNGHPFFPAVLDVLQATGTAPVKASKLAWRVAQLLTEHEADASGFGLAAPVAEGYLVMVHGPVRALITDATGELEMNGADTRTWVDRVVPASVERLALTLAAKGSVEAFPRSQLDDGIIPAGGLVLMSSAPAAEASPDAPSALHSPVAAPLPTPRSSPQPTSPRPSPLLLPSPGETMVVRRAVGVLVADDGTRTPLDRNYVVGREPQEDPDVISGAASPIVVVDPDNLISRAHAHVTVDTGGVMVRDNASGDGTYVAPPGAPEWMRLGPDAAPLPPGWSLRLGMRVFTHLAAPTQREPSAQWGSVAQ